MEGGQAPAPQPPSPAGPRKDDITVIVAVAAIAVIVVSIAAVLLMGGGDDEGTGIDNGNFAIEWDPAVGDYYEYTMSMSGTEASKMTYRVVAVTLTTMTINVTTEFMGDTTSVEETVPLGVSSDYVDQIDNQPDGYDLDYRGTQTITVNWGTITADHYQIAYSEGAAETTSDLWFYKGMMIKMTAGSGWSEMTIEMTDTNITDLTG
ncbi:MAG: hypothetical protein WC375_05770 [Methanomassiliicoccales archaeon]|jgi:hypothetical protein